MVQKALRVKGRVTHFKSRCGFQPIPVARKIELHPFINWFQIFFIRTILKIGAIIKFIPKHRYEKACHQLKFMK